MPYEKISIFLFDPILIEILESENYKKNKERLNDEQDSPNKGDQTPFILNGTIGSKQYLSFSESKYTMSFPEVQSIYELGTGIRKYI